MQPKAQLFASLKHIRLTRPDFIKKQSDSGYCYSPLPFFILRNYTKKQLESQLVFLKLGSTIRELEAVLEVLWVLLPKLAQFHEFGVLF